MANVFTNNTNLQKELEAAYNNEHHGKPPFFHLSDKAYCDECDFNRCGCIYDIAKRNNKTKTPCATAYRRAIRKKTVISNEKK